MVRPSEGGRFCSNGASVQYAVTDQEPAVHSGWGRAPVKARRKNDGSLLSIGRAEEGLRIEGAWLQ